MKTIIRYAISIAAVALLCSCSPSGSRKVWVCTGPMSECYHVKKHCKGLSHCSECVELITLEEAKDEGRRPCGYCCR